MHDEFERALGVRRRSGISFLGWLGLGLVGFFVLAGTGVFFAFRAASHQFHQVVEQMEARTSGEHPDLVARTVARTLAEMGSTPAAHQDRIATAVARALSASAGTTVETDAAQASPPSESATGSARSGDEEMEGFLRIRTEDGEIRADLRAGGDGGSLVVRDVDGEVLVDLSGDARGGRLYVRGEGEIASFRTGGSAADPPQWVPRPDARVDEVERVLSGHAGDGSFGARAWLTEGSPRMLVETFRAQLQREGWQVRAEHRMRNGEEVSASVVGRLESQGRTVLLTAGPEDGRTRVVLGWGEETASGR